MEPMQPLSVRTTTSVYPSRVLLARSLSWPMTKMALAPSAMADARTWSSARKPAAAESAEIAPEASGTVNVYIKTISGSTITIWAHPDLTVWELKGLIEDRDGVCRENYRLIYSGRSLDDARTLQSYQISANATLHIVARVLGD